jgi:hypothetical protein
VERSPRSPRVDPETELSRLKGRSQKVSSRYFRRVKLQRSYRFTILVVLAAVGSFAVTMGVMTLQPWSALSSSPWTAAMHAKHLAAYADCAAVRAVGLASAYRGQPGYWPQHDRDKDGIACEPYPRRW